MLFLVSAINDSIFCQKTSIQNKLTKVEKTTHSSSTSQATEGPLRKWQSCQDGIPHMRCICKTNEKSISLFIFRHSSVNFDCNYFEVDKNV